MNCQRFEMLVTDLARVQLIETGLRESALAHSECCPNCRLRFQAEKAISLGLATLAADTLKAEAPPQIEDYLLASFRARKFARSRIRAGRDWWWSAAVAAALLVLLGGLAVRMAWSGGVVTKELEPVAISELVPEIAPVTNVSSGASVPRPKKPISLTGNSKREVNRYSRNRRASARETIADASKSQREIANEFIPLGYGSLNSFQDGGQIVRVEVPRSEMVRWGLPVSMETNDQRVKVDILLSADGLARAIRFAQ